MVDCRILSAGIASCSCTYVICIIQKQQNPGEAIRFHTRTPGGFLQPSQFNGRSCGWWKPDGWLIFAPHCGWAEEHDYFFYMRCLFSNLENLQILMHHSHHGLHIIFPFPPLPHHIISYHSISYPIKVKNHEISFMISRSLPLVSHHIPMWSRPISGDLRALMIALRVQKTTAFSLAGRISFRKRPKSNRWMGASIPKIGGTGVKMMKNDENSSRTDGQKISNIMKVGEMTKNACLLWLYFHESMKSWLLSRTIPLIPGSAPRWSCGEEKLKQP